MKKIVVIHFLPLEYYPPVTNMINYLGNQLNESFYVFSVYNSKNRKTFSNTQAVIKRNRINYKSRLLRLMAYIYFQVNVLFYLLKIKPKNILYYESLSSYPVYLYKRYFNKSVRIFVHYHEYTSPEQYKNESMSIERYFHKKEQQFIYDKAVWISQTNKDRLNFFKKDNVNVDSKILKVMPNYPPKIWQNAVNKKKEKRLPVKCVYIGSLSLTTTYLKEFTDWLKTKNGEITLVIYSYNIHNDARKHLQQQAIPYLRFFDQGIEYEKMPAVLSRYDVGLILYNGSSMNFIYNAPNKLFEYLSCGLDVWFPEVMKGIRPYIRDHRRPYILPLNFNRLSTFNFKTYAPNSQAETSTDNFFCEEIYKDFLEQI